MNIHISEKWVTVKQSRYKKSAFLNSDTDTFQSVCVRHPGQTGDDVFWNI